MINTIVSILTPLSLVAFVSDIVGLVRLTTLMVCLASLNIFSQKFPPTKALHSGIGKLLDVRTISQTRDVGSVGYTSRFSIFEVATLGITARHALAELPETLDKTYERTLDISVYRRRFQAAPRRGTCRDSCI